MRDTLYTKTLSRIALPLATIADDGAVNGTTVDLGVYGNDFRTVMFTVHAGTLTDGEFAFTLEESLNGSDWTAVAARHTQGTLPTVDTSDTISEFGYVPNGKQYVRLVCTAAETTAGGPLSAVALCSGASTSPVARA